MSAYSASPGYFAALSDSPSFRHFRILLAAAASGFIFCIIGGRVLPMPDLGGAQAVASGPLASILAPAGLIAAMLLSMIISSLIVWPDGPHTGMFCAMAGFSALAVKVGSIKFLLLSRLDHPGAAYLPLVAQCAFFAIWVVIAEMAARVTCPWATCGRLWPNALGMAWPISAADTALPQGFPASTGWLTRSAAAREFSVVAVGSGIAALGLTVGVALVCEFFTLRSLAPGQVVFALVLSFYVGSFIAGLVFKTAPTIFYWLAPMVAAAVSYLLAMHMKGPYPGYPGFWGAAALPIYYASAGVAGTVMGFYSAMRTIHHAAFEGARKTQTA